jgi:hypothetical protein
MRDARGVSFGSFTWSARERREADLSLADPGTTADALLDTTMSHARQGARQSGLIQGLERRQEDEAGGLSPLPSCQALAERSTKRICAVLSWPRTAGPRRPAGQGGPVRPDPAEAGHYETASRFFRTPVGKGSRTNIRSTSDGRMHTTPESARHGTKVAARSLLDG